MLFYWLSALFSPASQPSLILFLWFPTLSLATVEFGTGDLSATASLHSLVASPRPSTGL